MRQTYLFKKAFRTLKTALSLPETAAALIIIALICSTIVVVFNNSTKSAANSARKIDAFEVAQQNMERLLASSYVTEGIEYGRSEKYPGVEWQTAVETFYEPITSRLWARAVSAANYSDIEGNPQTVELTSWLTDLTQAQVVELMKRKQIQMQLLSEAGRIILTIEDAADYAVADVNTIQQWIDNGMPLTENGYFIRDYIDLFKQYDGKPPSDQKAELDDKFNPILQPESQTEQSQTQPAKPAEPAKPGEQQKQPEKTRPEQKICGMTPEEWKAVPRDKFWELMMNCPEFWR